MAPAALSGTLVPSVRIALRRFAAGIGLSGSGRRRASAAVHVRLPRQTALPARPAVGRTVTVTVAGTVGSSNPVHLQTRPGALPQHTRQQRTHTTLPRRTNCQ